MLRKKPTIQDVARYASVSTATVSRALAMPEKVSDSMRERVNEAVRATGYTLNQAARSLRSKATKTILAALPNVSNPFFSPILGAIEEEAAARGYGVLVVNSTPDQSGHQRFEDYFRASRADGLILFDGSMRGAQVRNLFPDPESAAVVVACEEIDDCDFMVVKTDNFEASQTATNHLLDLGHVRIAHITAPRSNALYPERTGGYEAAMAAAGARIWPDYVVEGDFSIEGGAAAARKLLSLVRPPTAIFCANDEMAIGAISAAHEMGFPCPERLSVAGFDGISLAAHFLPPLTTMRQPTHEIGRIATQSLIDLLEGRAPSRSAARVVLKSELAVRGSTAPPPAAGKLMS